MVYTFSAQTYNEETYDFDACLFNCFGENIIKFNNVHFIDLNIEWVLKSDSSVRHHITRM